MVEVDQDVTKSSMFAHDAGSSAGEGGGRNAAHRCQQVPTLAICLVLFGSVACPFAFELWPTSCL